MTRYMKLGDNTCLGGTREVETKPSAFTGTRVCYLT